MEWAIRRQGRWRVVEVGVGVGADIADNFI